MSLLDWSPINSSPINRTPRTPAFSGTSEVCASRLDTVRPPAVASRPLTDWFAVACSIVAPQPDQNLVALADAVRAYRASYDRPAYEAMRDAATLCGMPDGEPPLAWSVARLNTYRCMMESA